MLHKLIGHYAMKLPEHYKRDIRRRQRRRNALADGNDVSHKLNMQNMQEI